MICRYITWTRKRCEGKPCNQSGTFDANQECHYYKEPNMSEKIAVHVPNRYLWEAVEKNEVEVRGKDKPTATGWKWERYGEESVIDVSSVILEYADYNWFHREPGWSIITVDEYFKRYGEYSPIKIGTYEVKNIDKEGFNVGCQRVSWETFDKIGAKRPKE